MKNVKKLFQLILIIILGAIICSVFLLLFKNKNYVVLITIITLLLIYFVLRNNIKLKIQNKYLSTILIIVIIFFTFYRIYLLKKIDFNLNSDFELYYSTATDILNKRINNPEYLAYNNYVYIFSSILALYFSIVDSSITSAVFFNIICQLLTIILLYFTFNDNRKILLVLPVLWFMMPNVLATTFLISTENFFILLFSLVMLIYYRFPYNNFKFFILGFLIAFANNIRPLMTLFIFILILQFIFWVKNKDKFLKLFIVITTFIITSFGFKYYCNLKIGIPKKAGATEWALYFGANYNTHGYWNEEDSARAFNILSQENGSNKLLKETIKRYKNMGIFRTFKLFIYKFYCLWSDVNGNYNFFTMQVSDSNKLYFNKRIRYNEFMSILIILIFIIEAINYLILKFRNINDKSDTFIILFIIFYVFFNLFTCVNGRYNYPLIILLYYLICCNKVKKYN